MILGRCVEVLLVSFSFALVFRWHRDSGRGSILMVVGVDL